MASRLINRVGELDKMRINILYCSLEGRMEALPLDCDRCSTIKDIKSIFSTRVHWTDILGEAPKDIALAKKLKFYHCHMLISCDTEPMIKDAWEANSHIWSKLFTLVFDQMVLEDNATLFGIGLADGDKLALTRKIEYCEKEYILNNQISHEFMEKGTLHVASDEMARRNSVHDMIVALTNRKAQEISVGLNGLIGEPDGLPIIQGDCHAHPTPEAEQLCHKQLETMKTALLPALGMTITDCKLPLPQHLPDFAPVMGNLVDNKYNHSHDCMKDINNILERYKKSTFVVANADIKYGGVDGKEEGSRREMILKRLKATVKEYQFSTSTNLNDSENQDNDKVYYIGPPRNSHPHNFLASMPTVQLKGIATNTTLQDMLHSYKTYTENSGFKVPRLCYDNREFDLQSKVKAACARTPVPPFKKFYFAFPLDPAMGEEDSRDINDLLEYIEGDEDKKSSEKKKKKKKKRKNLSSEKPTDSRIFEFEPAKSSSVVESNREPEDLSEKKNETEKKTEDEKDIIHIDSKSSVDEPLNPEEDKYLLEITQAISKRIEAELEVKKSKLENLQKDKIALEKSLEDELAHLDSHKAGVEKIIESKSKEMKNVIMMIEKTEDEKHENTKRITDIDSKLVELEAQTRRLKEDKRRLIGDCDKAEEQMKKYVKKKSKLENFLTSEMKKAQKDGNAIEEKVNSLRQKIAENELALQNLPNEQIHQPAKTPEPNKQLIDFIDKQIEEKEKELECPVCLEIATVPIFMCLELHLICSDCRAKLVECPECRQPYSGKPKRHRYAEKTAEELVRLKTQRKELLTLN